MMKNAYFLFIVITAVFIANSDCFRINRQKRSTGSACNQAPNSGMCMALFINYYYNKTTNTCNKFVYGGCGGNDNNFPTGEECTRVCGGTVVESDRNSAPIFPALFPENEFISPEACDLPMEVGICRAAFPRYYFDGEKCEEFIYGGCQGNENNFRTLEQCLDKCGHKIPVGDNEVSGTEEE